MDKHLKKGAWLQASLVNTHLLKTFCVENDYCNTIIHVNSFDLSLVTMTLITKAFECSITVKMTSSFENMSTSSCLNHLWVGSLGSFLLAFSLSYAWDISSKTPLKMACMLVAR